MLITLEVANSAIRHLEEIKPEGFTILCYISSKEDNWLFHFETMMKELSMKKDTMYKYLDLLIKLGWLKRVKIKKEGNPLECIGTKYLIQDKYSEFPKFRENRKDNVSTYLTSTTYTLNSDVDNKKEMGNNNISFRNSEKIGNTDTMPCNEDFDTNLPNNANLVNGEELQRKIKHKLGEDTLAVFNAYPEKNTKGEMQPIKKTYADAEAIADFIDKNNITSEGMIDCFNAFIDLCDAKDIYYPYLSTHLKDFAAKFRRWGSAENVVKDYQQSMEKAERMQSTTKYETQIKELKTYIPSDVTITDDRDYPRVVALFNLYGTDEVLNAFKRGKIRTRKTLASVLSCIEQQKSETMPCVNF